MSSGAVVSGQISQNGAIRTDDKIVPSCVIRTVILKKFPGELVVSLSISHGERVGIGVAVAAFKSFVLR